MAQFKDLIVNGQSRFIGNVYVATPIARSNTEQIANTTYVQSEITYALNHINVEEQETAIQVEGEN